MAGICCYYEYEKKLIFEDLVVNYERTKVKFKRSNLGESRCYDRSFGSAVDGHPFGEAGVVGQACILAESWRFIPVIVDA